MILYHLKCFVQLFLLKTQNLIGNDNDVDANAVRRNDVNKKFGKELYYLNLMSKIVVRLIGVTRYMQLLRAMRFYSRYEVQIHLLDKQFMKDNLY